MDMLVGDNIIESYILYGLVGTDVWCVRGSCLWGGGGGGGETWI